MTAPAARRQQQIIKKPFPGRTRLGQKLMPILTCPQAECTECVLHPAHNPNPCSAHVSPPVAVFLLSTHSSLSRTFHTPDRNHSALLQIRKPSLLRLGTLTKVTYLESGGTSQATKMGKCSSFVEKFSPRHKNTGFQLTLCYPEQPLPQKALHTHVCVSLNALRILMNRAPGRGPTTGKKCTGTCNHIL